MRTVLVTGSDTGVGKTHVVAALARRCAADGARVQIVKPVETGTPHFQGQQWLGLLTWRPDPMWQVLFNQGAARAPGADKAHATIAPDKGTPDKIRRKYPMAASSVFAPACRGCSARAWLYPPRRSLRRRTKPNASATQRRARTRAPHHQR